MNQHRLWLAGVFVLFREGVFAFSEKIQSVHVQDARQLMQVWEPRSRVPMVIGLSDGDAGREPISYQLAVIQVAGNMDLGKLNFVLQYDLVNLGNW